MEISDHFEDLLFTQNSQTWRFSACRYVSRFPKELRSLIFVGAFGPLTLVVRDGLYVAVTGLAPGELCAILMG